MLEWVTAGESHGKSLIGVITGVPASIELQTQHIAAELQRRRFGYGRGARQAWEADEITVLSGLKHGATLGSPIAIEIGNSEWPKWMTVMNPDPVDAADLLIDAGTGDEREIARNKKLTRPRPGHADLPGMLKYGVDDARTILERASARETATRVALGAVAKAILKQIADVEIVSLVVGIGTAHMSLDAPRPRPEDMLALDENPVRCPDPEVAQEMIRQIDEAKAQGDTIGGVVEVIAYNVPIGLGTHTHALGKLDANLAAALMSIQAVKGVEIGDGFTTATRRGTQAHDEIIRDEAGLVTRSTNRAGGIEGGISNGRSIVARAALKPISTVPRALASIDLATGETAQGLHQRSDTCAVVPAAVIAEAEMALVLARALLEKTGGDSLQECRLNLDNYLRRIGERLRKD
ncbi:MAG: chorismate synthase [Actinomycetaceae bacterium]|nr:chorismate synthase [Actinomycetaceae bacterium]